MKKFFVIITTLYISHQHVNSFPDKWRTIQNTNPLESKEFLYYHTINQTLTKRKRSISVTETSESDGKIFFPDDEPKIRIDSLSLGRPIGPVPACHNSTFCEHAPHYPTEFVRNAIKMRDDLKYFSTINQTTQITERIAANTAGTSTNIFESHDDDALCLAREQTVYPKSAENKDKQWLFVVNDDEFPQGVCIQTCMSDNDRCRIIDGFAEGYVTSCRQKYIYRQLAAITSDGTVGPDLFRFPSSCCCHIKFIGSPSTRMYTGIKLKSEPTSIN